MEIVETMDHISSGRQLLLWPIRSSRKYMNRLVDNFGLKFTIMMASAYFGVKGALYSFNGLAALPYYKKLGVSGRDYQVYGSIGLTPFAMKALIGAVSDSIPLFGYHKCSYILISAALGSVAYMILGSVLLSAQLAAAMFFLVTVEIAMVDLLCEGKYVELMRQKPETGSTLVTWVWATYNLGSLLASLITGPVADYADITVVFWICVPIAAQVVFPIAMGYLQDKRLPAGDRGVRWAKLAEHPKLFILSIAMSGSALGQAMVNFMWRSSPASMLAYSLTVSVVLIAMAFWAMPRILAKANLFLFFDSMLYIQIGGAMDYWFTAKADCVPGGPSFDYTYYSTYTRIVSSIAAWAGTLLFQAVMSHWKIRKICWFTTILRCVAGAFDIILVQRLNVGLGISDKVMYMIGDAIIYEVCYMMHFMPTVMLISKLCPKDLESTTYALLAGFANFGQQVSRALGVMFISRFDIQTEVPCQWEGLSWLIAVTHIFVPLLIVPAAFMLTPDALLTDDIVSGIMGPRRVRPPLQENDFSSLQQESSLSTLDESQSSGAQKDDIPLMRIPAE